MKRKLLPILFVLTVFIVQAQIIVSPNKKLSLQFSLSKIGEPMYQLRYSNTAVVLPSKLGLKTEEGNLIDGFEIVSADTTTFFEKWKPVWGEIAEITNHYKQLSVQLIQSNSKKKIKLCFRLFNDGLGFRYEFPSQSTLNYFVVTSEQTEFNLTGDHKTFWIPGDYDTNEYPYNTSKLSEVNATIATTVTEISTRKPIGKNIVQTPLMMKSADGLYINIHEATLVNYPAMQIEINQSSYSLKSALVPDAAGNMAYLQTPYTTPWCTLVVRNDVRDILQSKLILNLNESSVIKNTDWIKPMKFIGIWWAMHVGVGTWNFSDSTNTNLVTTDWKNLPPNGKHAATTSETKRYIDFASKHGFKGILVE